MKEGHFCSPVSDASFAKCVIVGPVMRDHGLVLGLFDTVWLVFDEVWFRSIAAEPVQRNLIFTMLPLPPFPLPLPRLFLLLLLLLFLLFMGHRCLFSSPNSAQIQLFLLFCGFCSCMEYREYGCYLALKLGR